VRRFVSVVIWAGGLALGAFGIYFSFANYPLFAITLLLLTLLAVGFAERKRRQRWRASDRARRMKRAG
jgi:hypothetical protein